MKVITKNTDYAIRALVALSRHNGDFLSAKEIAERQDIPYEFLRKILNQLIKKDLVVSREGGLGGFHLKVAPSKIKLSDVITIFQGNIQISQCMFRQKICPQRSSCLLRKNILRIEQKVADEFDKITIEQLKREKG